MKAFISPGLFTAHDIWHQVVRLYYYYQGINDGQFPPYWIGQLANGFGYPLFFFSYHLPWLIGVPFLKIGLDIPTTIKILFFIPYIGSGITMYFFVNSLLKNKLSALLSSILYLWLPYHFLTIFVSASMGIAFVFAFLPLILLGIHLLKEKNKIGIPILSIGTSGVILSHIMHLLFLSPLILIFFLWEFFSLRKKKDFLINVAFGIILGLLISSFYLLPAYFYNQSTRVNRESGFSQLYQRNFITLSQLIYSKWGFSPIVNNAKGGEISFQLGIAQWIAVLALTVLIVLNKLTKSYQGLGIYILFSFIVSIFLMLDFSKPFWDFFIKRVAVDFPFRFLLPTTFIASLAAGLVVINIRKKFRIFLFLFFMLVAIYTNRNHINVNLYTNFPIATYLDLETEKTTNTFNEYLPLQADTKLLNKPWNEVQGEKLSVSNLKRTTNLLSFDLNAAKETTASIGQFYFPGQTLYLDNKLYQFSIDKEGRISFKVPEGIHTVMIKYQETSLIKLSKGLTIIGISLMIFLLLKALNFSKRRF